MKARPIIFSGPMVRAILDGRKTQTRRIVKHKMPLVTHVSMNETGAALRNRHTGERQDVECPYGKPGDRLWVRERWGAIKNFDHLPPREIPVGSAIGYATDGPERWCQTGCGGAAGKWRPSIHMPRCFSRITLEITDVRAERLQDISNEDAVAEWVKSFDQEFPLRGERLTLPQHAFAHLWNSINGADAWDANPYVWALTFRKVEPA